MRGSRALVLTLLAAALLGGRPAAAAPASGDSTLAAAPDSALASVEAPEPFVLPTARERVLAWAMDAAGPSAIAGNLVGASWRQWATEEPAEWHNDGRGFAQRFGAGSLTTFLGETSLALASAALHQDARYYRSPRAGFAPRAAHALAMTVLARDRDGDAVLSPGKALAPFVGPTVTVTTLYPERYTLGDALLSGAYALLVNAGWNAAREFVLGAPAWGEGRPPIR